MVRRFVAFWTRCVVLAASVVLFHDASAYGQADDKAAAQSDTEKDQRATLSGDRVKAGERSIAAALNWLARHQNAVPEQASCFRGLHHSDVGPLSAQGCGEAGAKKKEKRR